MKSKKRIALRTLCLFALMTHTIKGGCSSSIFAEPELKEIFQIYALMLSNVIALKCIAVGFILQDVGEKHIQDLPVTDSERHFFVMRNLLPKGDLERAKNADKKTGHDEVAFGKFLVGFGALCSLAGFAFVYFYDSIFGLKVDKNTQ